MEHLLAKAPGYYGRFHEFVDNSGNLSASFLHGVADYFRLIEEVATSSIGTRPGAEPAGSLNYRAAGDFVRTYIETELAHRWSAEVPVYLVRSEALERMTAPPEAAAIGRVMDSFERAIEKA